jgi:hypothetical protein
MTDEVQGKSRGVRELTEALNRQPFIAEENLALDLDFRKRLREVISPGRGNPRPVTRRAVSGCSRRLLGAMCGRCSPTRRTCPTCSPETVQPLRWPGAAAIFVAPRVVGRALATGKLSMREPNDSAKDAAKTLRLVTRDGERIEPGRIVDDRRPPPDPPADPIFLDVGSDVEISRRLVRELREELGEIHWAEGRLWCYGGTRWLPYPEDQSRLKAHRYDGALSVRPGRKNAEAVQLGRARLNSIINEFATIVAAPDFFEDRAVGINCRSGFLAFDEAGQVSVLPHHPHHRARHLLPGRGIRNTTAPGSPRHRIVCSGRC